MRTQKTIDEWLMLAYRGSTECPPPELFLSAEWGALSDEDLRKAEAHAASCPACGAERELARAFDAPAAASEEMEAGLKKVLAAVHARPSSAHGRGQLLSFPAMARVLSRPALGLVAAAIAVFAVGIVIQMRTAGPPELPTVPIESVTRGGGVEVIAPAGFVMESPAVLEWRAVEGAVRYRVTLSAVDGAILWQGESAAAAVEIPDEIRFGLRPAVVYFWQVDAFDERDSRIAWSPATEFRVDLRSAEESR